MVVFEDGSGKITQREHGTMNVKENIKEDELRNQSHPVGRNTLMFVFHWLCCYCCCSLFFKQKDITLLNRLKRNCVKSKVYDNLNSYEGFSLPFFGSEKGFRKQSTNFDS